MQRKLVLLAGGAAVGVLLIVLGTLAIWNCSAVGLGIPIDDVGDDYGGYFLMPPNREGIVAGVLMVAIGSIAVSVSLTLMILPRMMTPRAD